MNRTKDMIADAFGALLDEKPISKITVKDIVDRCGVNRNTFYYHFQDIPDLCEHIWKQKIDELIESHCSPDSPKEALSVAVQFFSEHKTAMLHIYRSLPRDVFQRYLDQLAVYLVQEYISTVTAETVIPSDRKDFLVRYYKCVLVGIFLDWLDSSMSYDLLEFGLLVFDLRSEEGQQMLEQMGISSPKEDTSV